MSILAIIGLMIFMLLGLIVAFKGFELLKAFVRMAGGIILSIAMLFFGLFVGAFLGPVWVIVLGIAFAILGFIIGYLIAPTILWLILAIIVFSIFWTLGWSVAEHFGADVIILYIAAFASGIIGAYLFSIFAKRLMVGATSALGALMFSVPLFILLMGPLGVMVAGAIAIASFIVLSIAGFFSQRGKGSKGPHKNRKRKR